jgi:hypothetical protein
MSRLDSSGMKRESSTLLALLVMADDSPCCFFFFNLSCIFRLLALSSLFWSTCKSTDNFLPSFKLLTSS